MPRAQKQKPEVADAGSARHTDVLAGMYDALANCLTVNAGLLREIHKRVSAGTIQGPKPAAVPRGKGTKRKKAEVSAPAPYPRRARNPPHTAVTLLTTVAAARRFGCDRPTRTHRRSRSEPRMRTSSSWRMSG